MAEAATLRRHDLLDVEPGAWAAILAGRPDLDGVPHLADWARRGWPVIVRRRNPGEATDGIAVGLPLPLAEGKRRIGLVIPRDAGRPRPPVTLASVRAPPPSWRPAIHALAPIAEAHGSVPRVFGALLWQALTGLTYLSETSDLDLIWPVAGRVDRRMLEALAVVEADAPMRLDGEIVLPDGAGINWREFHDAAPGGTVLAKGRESVALRPVASLLAGAPA